MAKKYKEKYSNTLENREKNEVLYIIFSSKKIKVSDDTSIWRRCGMSSMYIYCWLESKSVPTF